MKTTHAKPPGAVASHFSEAELDAYTRGLRAARASLRAETEWNRAMATWPYDFDSAEGMGPND
jgi:hypothetical protein